MSVPLDSLDIRNCDIILAEQSTVHDDYLFIDQMGQWQPVEDLRETIEHLDGIFGFDFALKSVHLIHVYAFVVSSSHEEVVGIEELIGKHQKYNLNTEWSTINIVTIE